MSNNDNFRNTINISERLEEEQYHIELVLRFIGLRFFKYSPRNDVKFFLDDSLDYILKEKEFDFDGVKANFEKLFHLLDECFDEQVFKKYEFETKKFKGKFLESAFEAITVGISSIINAQYNC